MTGKIMPLRERDTSTIQAAADAFLSSPRYANPSTRRGYTGVLDRLLAGLGASRPLAEVSGEELAGLLEQLWGQRAPATWNRNRGAVAAWLSWCAASRRAAPGPAGLRRTAPRAPQRHPRGTPPGDRPGAVPSRRSAAGEDPVADAVRDRRPGQRGAGAEHRRPRPGRPPRPDPLQGRRHRMDLLGLRHRAPAAPPYPRPPGRTGVPVRASPWPRLPPAAKDLCPVTGRARLGYDRARVLFTRYTGWELHQLRHSAATHLGEQGIPLQLIMAKTRHRNPRTAMRYVRPGAQAVAEITALLEPPRRRG